MNENQIIQRIMAERYRRSTVCPRYTPTRWWECDVFELTEAGFFREYEVKISRGDFAADRLKETHQRYQADGRSSRDGGSHQFLKRRKHRLERRLAKLDPENPPSYGKYKGYET